MERTNPNIYICGPPGIGKSKISDQVSKLVGLTYLNVEAIAKENNAVDTYDEKYTLPPVRESDVLNILKDSLCYQDGHVVDYYTPNLFCIDGGTFDAIFVLEMDENLLYSKLIARKYDNSLINYILNMIHFNSVYCDARDIYPKRKIYSITVNTEDQRNDAVEKICYYVKKFRHERTREMERRLRLELAEENAQIREEEIQEGSDVEDNWRDWSETDEEVPTEPTISININNFILENLLNSESFSPVNFNSRNNPPSPSSINITQNENDANNEENP